MMVTIRIYRPNDLETLRQILVESFEGVSIDQNIECRFGSASPLSWQTRKGRHLDDDVCRDPHGIFVAEADGQIAGFISTWIDRDAQVGFIPNLAVRAEYRGHGLGRRLLNTALDHFRAKGMKLARIETLDQNPIGQHLYPATGFVEVAREIHFAMKLS